MDFLDLLYIEMFISVFWAIYVFAPIAILIYGDYETKYLGVMTVIRIFILVILLYIISDGVKIFLGDIFVLVVLAMIFFFVSKIIYNPRLSELYKLSKNDSAKYKRNNRVVRKDEIKPEIKPETISKDENKVRVIRSKVISNQKEYLKDNYNLGGSEHNKENSYGNNNDGDYSNRVTLSNHSNEGVYMSRDMNSTIQELCTYCGEEVKSDFIYCPSCGKPIVSKMIQDTDGFK